MLRKFPIFSVWQLRAAIAPCIESVFLLDRLCYLHEKVLFYIRHLDNSLYLFMSWHNVFFMRFCCLFLWTQILKLSPFIHILFVCLYYAFIFLLESQHYTCSRSYNRYSWHTFTFFWLLLIVSWNLFFIRVSSQRLLSDYLILSSLQDATQSLQLRNKKTEDLCHDVINPWLAFGVPMVVSCCCSLLYIMTQQKSLKREGTISNPIKIPGNALLFGLLNKIGFS